MIPRFYTVSSWAAIIVIVYWVQFYLYRYRPRLAIFLGVSLVATNLLCIYVENKDPAFAERALIAYTVQQGAIVHTDPKTLNIANLLSEFKGVSNRVVSDPVPAGRAILLQ